MSIGLAVSWRQRGLKMLKSLFLLLTFISMTACTKSHDLTLTICDIDTNCKKCYEVVKASYSVDIITKRVTVSGNSVEGKDINEVNNKCKVIDGNNWTCDSAFMTTQAKDGVLTIANKPESSLVNNKKEVCLIHL
jgi:hypothetical protein